MADFGYPETIKYRAGCIVSKSRKLPDGQFEAVAAFFFEGKRMNQKFAVAASRHKAIRDAEHKSETGK